MTFYAQFEFNGKYDKKSMFAVGIWQSNADICLCLGKIIVEACKTFLKSYGTIVATK